MDEQIDLEARLQSFIFKEIDPLDFERLVINQPKFEKLVGDSLYTDMLACNYRLHDQVAQLRQKFLSWAIDYYQVSKDNNDMLLGLSIVVPCRAFLENEISLIEACRQLNSVYNKHFKRWESFEEFNIIIAVASDSDHLPVGLEAKEFWNQDAVKAKEGEIKELETQWCPEVTEACKHLIDIYGNSN